MPAAMDPEFRRRAVELAGLREKPIAQIAKHLGIAEPGFRRWMKQADIDDGAQDGLEATSAELVELRRDKRFLEMEVETSSAPRPSSRENVLPR